MVQLGIFFSAMRYAMRCAMTRVLPEPAPARMRSGPSVARTASRCCSLSCDKNSESTGVDAFKHRDRKTQNQPRMNANDRGSIRVYRRKSAAQFDRKKQID